MCMLCQNVLSLTDSCTYTLGATGFAKPLTDPDGIKIACPAATIDLSPAADSGDSSAGTNAALPIFDAGQIADYLTDGFWASSGGARSFDAVAGDTLFVDISRLQDDGQTLARIALDAWSDVTGLIFQEITPSGSGAAARESTDAPAANTTPYALTVGEFFEGALDYDGDRDRVALTLTASQTVTITLAADNWNGTPLSDPELRVYDAHGALLAQDDDSVGLDARLVFAAPASGTYYLEAAAYGDFYSGGYRLSVEGVAQSADITFSDLDSGAYASFDTTGATINSAFVNINVDWSGGGDRIDSYHYQTYLHEIGHALGLGHAGDYNGGATFGTDNHYQNDSWQMSVMSYFDQRENDMIDGTFAFALTPQIADIVAVRDMYGSTSLRAGDTVYGQDATTGTYLDDVAGMRTAVAMTVLDDGGWDVLNFAQTLMNQKIDLAPGAHSSVLGLTGNLSIASETIIEAAISGDGQDWLSGNEVGNLLQAGAGNDVLFGRGGVDTLEGGDGADYLNAGSGGGLMDGGQGGDLLVGGGLTAEEIEALLSDPNLPIEDLWPLYADELI